MSRSYRVVGILALVVASLLVTVSPAAAASATGKNFTLPAVNKTTYSISGTVRANATSALVPNVQVYAYNTTTYGSFTYGYATTNASGAYTISHLLPGSYDLRFDPLRATNLQHGYRGGPGPAYFSVSTPALITITTATIYGANIRLPAGFKISGKVTRSNGTTVIPNAAVSASGTYGSDDTTTDSAGNYTLMGLSPGSYQVSFGHDPTASNQTGCWYTAVASKFSASCASHTAVVIGSANVAGVSPKIPNALKITGYVKTRASVPIANAWVDANGPVYESAYTDATGKYTIAGLNPGSYKVMVGGPSGSRIPYGYYYATGPNYWTMATASASSVAISAAVTTLPIIKPATGYFIKGKITNTSGVALDSVLVEATGGIGTANQYPAAFTDALGNYSIGPLPFSSVYSYKINANPAYSSDPTLQTGWYLNSPPNNFTTAASSALAILVTGDKTGINMRLPKGATISGIVKITGGSACSDCEVFALDLTGAVVAYASTSISGAYTLQGLSAGSYKVWAGGSDTIIDSTHVRIITSGYYKSGLAPNYSATFAGGTAIAVS